MSNKKRSGWEKDYRRQEKSLPPGLSMKRVQLNKMDKVLDEEIDKIRKRENDASKR